MQQRWRRRKFLLEFFILHGPIIADSGSGVFIADLKSRPRKFEAKIDRGTALTFTIRNTGI
jgi:hypothetical protein